VTTRMLSIEHMSAYYGASQIVHDVSFSVLPGKVSCLLGLNGMGKTTTLRSIMGLVDRIDGEVRLDGVPLRGPTYTRGRAGVTLVPEDRKVFPTLTVRENLEVAATGKPAIAGGEPITIAEMIELFPRLGERLTQKAGSLSGGEQQMLVVARALVANPKYILLDEPTEGLAPSYVQAIRDSILEAARRGIGVLLVEQSLPVALSVGSEFLVMDRGGIELTLSREEAHADRTRIESLLTLSEAEQTT
jgi:branched-chain amino acid transport system ATP-binding protein